jgi:hypothetical protein
MRISTALFTLAALAVILTSSRVQAAEASLLDLSEPEHGGEALLGVTLQGLVNRAAPRLFIRSHFWVNPASDDFWVRYLSEHKGFHFTKLGSLNEAVARFVREGLVKGLVVYDPARYADSCVAATLAAQRNLLPVTADMLAYRTPLLAGAASWTVDGMTHAWGDWFAQRRVTPAGLLITADRDRGKVPSAPGAQRWVKLDLAATPLLEVDIAQATGLWGMMVNVGSRDDDAPMVFPYSAHTGTLRCDLRPFLSHGADRALLRLCVRDKGDSVTVRRVRLLAADGSAPQVKPVITECFRDLPIVEDLRGRFKDEDAAYAWAMTELMPGCSKKMAFSALPGWWNMMGADLAIAQRAFLFHQNNKEIRRDYPLFDQVLKALDPPAALLGWGMSEWLMTWRVSEMGDFVLCSGAPNLSFWAQVPLDAPFTLPQPQLVKGPLQPKHYVIFYAGDGDAPKTIAGVQNGDWTDPARGTVPMAWGMQPYLMKLCPALMEYYAKAATPADSFFSGPSGAGYTYPVTMPNLDQYVDLSRGCMAAAGIGTLDEWDLVKLDLKRVHARFTAPGPSPPVRCFLQAPMGMGQGAANLWLDDGTPVIMAENATPERSLWAVMPRDFDPHDSVADLTRRITAVAEAHEAPYFIAVYSHLSPTFCRQVTQRLPADRFEVIGIGDLERLAREAGELTASAVQSGVGPGAKVRVELVRRNPDGASGDAGTVNWSLPPGWSASEASWPHDAVPPRGILRHALTVTCPAGQARAAARLEFRDTRLPCPAGLRLECYPELLTVDDFANADGWRGEKGGALTVAGGIGHFTGRDGGSRLVRSLDIDLDRAPVLEVLASAYDGKWGVSVDDGRGEKWLLRDSPVQGSLCFDLARLTGWTGKRHVTLAVYPAMSFGTWVDLKSISLGYGR